MDKFKYAITIHCVYEGPAEETFEKCMIRPATLEDEEYNGMNYVCGAYRETFDFYIVDDLEEAILSTHFNPEAIEFENLDEDEVVQKDKIIAKYGWDPIKGVYKKVFLQENKGDVVALKEERLDLKYHKILTDVFNNWAETDKETGGFNLPHIYEFAKSLEIEIKE